MGSKNILSKTGINIVSTEEAFKDRAEFELEKPIDIVKPTIFINRGDILSAVKAGLIPEAYKDCNFDIEKIKDNQRAQYISSSRKFIVRRFDDYKDVTTGIISTIISNMIPTQSYIIGAPNGFGKTSFVNTCILKLHAQGRMCVPYISLSDLAQVRLQNERQLLSGVISDKYYGYEAQNSAYLGDDYMRTVYDQIDDTLYTKKPIDIIDKFSWSEYMNSDVLFCYFTNVSAKVIESEMLKTVLTIRGSKGLPTIAMIGTSLNPYKNDKYLYEYVWDEILAYGDTGGYDRVTHISCYKDFNAPLMKSNNKE